MSKFHLLGQLRLVRPSLPWREKRGELQLGSVGECLSVVPERGKSEESCCYAACYAEKSCCYAAVTGQWAAVASQRSECQEEEAKKVLLLLGVV